MLSPAEFFDTIGVQERLEVADACPAARHVFSKSKAPTATGTMLIRRGSSVWVHTSWNEIHQPAPEKCRREGFERDDRGDTYTHAGQRIHRHHRAVTRYFDKHNVRVLLVRPDRYVFGAGSSRRTTVRQIN